MILVVSGPPVESEQVGLIGKIGEHSRTTLFVELELRGDILEDPRFGELVQGLDGGQVGFVFMDEVEMLFLHRTGVFAFELLYGWHAVQSIRADAPESKRRKAKIYAREGCMKARSEKCGEANGRECTMNGKRVRRGSRVNRTEERKSQRRVWGEWVASVSSVDSQLQLKQEPV